jgi:hypothetical protein
VDMWIDRSSQEMNLVFGYRENPNLDWIQGSRMKKRIVLGKQRSLRWMVVNSLSSNYTLRNCSEK